MRLNKMFLLFAFVMSLSISTFAEVVEVDANKDGTVDYRLEWSDTGDLVSKEMVSGSMKRYSYQKISKATDEIKVFSQLNADGSADPSQMVLLYAKGKDIFMAKTIHEMHGVRTIYYVDNVMVAVEAQDTKSGITTSKSFLVDGKEKIILSDNDKNGIFEDVVIVASEGS